MRLDFPGVAGFRMAYTVVAARNSASKLSRTPQWRRSYTVCHCTRLCTLDNCGLDLAKTKTESTTPSLLNLLRLLLYRQLRVHCARARELEQSDLRVTRVFVGVVVVWRRLMCIAAAAPQ